MDAVEKLESRLDAALVRAKAARADGQRAENEALDLMIQIGTHSARKAEVERDAAVARAEAAEAALAAANARADHATHRAAKTEVDVDEADMRCDDLTRLLSEGLEIVESLSAGHDVWAGQVRRALGA